MNDSVIIVNSKKDLILQGYISDNINKEFIYQGNNFLLKQPGITNNMSMLNHGIKGYNIYASALVPTKPLWEFKIGDITLDIVNIS
jgi:hypothetical protein